MVTTAVHEMNKGKRGEFFGTTYDSEVALVANKDYGNKTYQNYILITDSYSPSGVKLIDDSFYEMQVYNDTHNSGTVPIEVGNEFDSVAPVNGVLVKYRNEEYRLFTPRDSVINSNLSIFDNGNLYLLNGGIVPTDDEYYFRKRIKGDYIITKFKYNNTLNNRFVIGAINTVYNINHR
jgi:hypothetical protein